MIESCSSTIMVDCGIMDTDPQPYPDVSTGTLEKVKYLFITHCHKDHIGALPYLISLGFHGVLVTSMATYELAELKYEHVLLLEEPNGSIALENHVNVCFGRSGHCVGSLWFHLETDGVTYFFSGDYQEDTLVHLCDPYTGDDDFAVIDCAHISSGESAAARRADLLLTVKEELARGKKVLLPVQKYGRGIEMYYQVKTQLDRVFVRCDSDFYNNTTALLKYPHYLKPDEAKEIFQYLPFDLNRTDWDILFIGEAHIEKQENRDYLSGILNECTIISTGRIKPHGILETWMHEGHVLNRVYSHHQSESDMAHVLTRNHFKVVFPFHNNEKKVIWGSI